MFKIQNTFSVNFLIISTLINCIKSINYIFAEIVYNLGRILAIDFGKKRTGIAVTDELQIIASGLTTVNTDEIFVFLKEYISKEKLSKEIPQIEVKRVDERFTSKMAFQTMIDGGLKKNQRKNKALVDEISATIILQSYLYNK